MLSDLVSYTVITKVAFGRAFLWLLWICKYASRIVCFIPYSFNTATYQKHSSSMQFTTLNLKKRVKYAMCRITLIMPLNAYHCILSRSTPHKCAKKGFVMSRDTTEAFNRPCILSYFPCLWCLSTSNLYAA